MTGVSQPVPQYCPSPVELDDLELLLSGAVPGVGGFNQPDSPITLRLPDTVGQQAAAAGAVELVDPEGLPLARVAWPDGTVEPLSHAAFGPFRNLRVTPEQFRAANVGRTVVPVTDALTTSQLHQVAGLGQVALVALVGTGTPRLSPVALVRATLAAAAELDDAVVVTVPLASHGDPDTDRMLRWAVLSTYVDHDAQPPLVELDETTDVIYPPTIAAIVSQDQPPKDEQGLVLFFTGLSGSGKSTLARALVDRLLEQGKRTVTSLDGDVVRRHLSAGLTFSKQDRETNIRRIGWVAAEIARHGGVAVVSPIAPFDETRQQVRAMVDDAGGAFFLIHVATPLEECERRDRKGLYAKARAGEIPEFTGISSPYEEPEDADVRVDTTGRSIEAALDDVLEALREADYLDLTPSVVEVRGAPATSLETSQAGAGTAPQPASPGWGTSGAEVIAATSFHVLFVCTANICRSASLEALARHAAPEGTDLVFSSAGTHGWTDQHVDEAIRAALPAEIDATDFRSRQLTKDLLDEADLVLTAESAHRSHILDEQPQLFRKVYT
ncbi:MAG: adenylyl-sulfate kinase, partial [Nocardioides sp.]|nr:adenylyl-sulfate kinase [Nocardioides sp.]